MHFEGNNLVHGVKNETASHTMYFILQLKSLKPYKYALVRSDLSRPFYFCTTTESSASLKAP